MTIDLTWMLIFQTLVRTAMRAGMHHISILFTACLLSILLPLNADSAAKGDEGYIRSADGVRIFYKVVGNGPESLIILHGGPGNTMDSLLPDLEPLARKYRLIYYDQRGSGRSDLVKQTADLSIDKHIEDLEAVREHFSLPRINLLGNSWGGILAGYYAIRHPERINRLVLHCAASPSYEHMRSFAPFIINRLPAAERHRFQKIANPAAWLTSPDPLQLCREFYTMLIPVYFADAANARRMLGDTCSGSKEAVSRQLVTGNMIWQSLGRWNILPQLKEVTAPTLVIHGAEDMIPLESSRDWTEALTDARLLVIENAGHMSHVEQPKIFFEAIERFLEGDWPESAVTIEKILPMASRAVASLKAEAF